MDIKIKPQIVFILGGPGSGKGTQCQIMKQKYQFTHFSTGDLLREFIKIDCEEARIIKDMIAQGKLVPSKMLVQIIRNNLFKQGLNKKTYLIDGFPRSAQNYQAWKQVIGDEVQIKTLLYLDCTLQTLEGRCLQRGKLSGRLDDNIETIRKRFRTYTENTLPFLQFYRQNGGEVHVLNGQNRVSEVENNIKKVLTEKNLVK